MNGYIKKSDAHRVVLHRDGDSARAAISELPCEDVIPVRYILGYLQHTKKEISFRDYEIISSFTHSMIGWYKAEQRYNSEWHTKLNDLE